MNQSEPAFARFVSTLSTEELRREFHVGGLFRPGEANFHYWETDRTVMGGITPTQDPLDLPVVPALRSAFFLERREAGVINLGGPGTVTVDGAGHAMDPLDSLYLGRGVKAVTFASRSADAPAQYYLLSYPAHCAYPTRHIPIKDAAGTRLGTRETANERTLYKLIHPGAFPTCQLVMGVTRIEPGSVWNTMPPHTHLRRSEAYLYFNVAADQAVFHFMGAPQSSRHLVMHNLEGVVSPAWSIHSGAGTSHYSFIWGMGGENQEFADMDAVPIKTIL